MLDKGDRIGLYTRQFTDCAAADPRKGSHQIRLWCCLNIDNRAKPRKPRKIVNMKLARGAVLTAQNRAFLGHYILSSTVGTRQFWCSSIICFWMPSRHSKEHKYNIFRQYCYTRNVPVFTNTGTFQYLEPEVYVFPYIWIHACVCQNTHFQFRSSLTQSCFHSSLDFTSDDYVTTSFIMVYKTSCIIIQSIFVLGNSFYVHWTQSVLSFAQICLYTINPNLTPMVGRCGLPTD